MGAHSTVLDSILPLHNLETVCLDWVYFVSAIPEGLQRKTTWRQVTYLSMPSHRAWVHTMFDFARLPNLQHLVLELGLSTDFPDESSDSDEDGQEKPVGLKLHTLEGGFNSRLFGRRDGEDPLARRQTNELARYSASFGYLAKLASRGMANS
ncbi:hypothetical protein FRC07_006622 [Ceratobasidium sp. 392]|nr:hypothetical protein FRC07_006622 [Ceratobasidium sp. 392]